MTFARLAQFLRDYFIAIFSFLLIFLLTLFTYFETEKKAEERNEKMFQIRAGQATEAIEKRLHDYVQILVGAKALFLASDTITRSDWQAYYRMLELEKNYPGIQGFGYAQVVRPQQLDVHEQQIRNEGFPEYKVHPEGARALYAAIIYLEPFTGRNLRAFGYDMFSEPVRQSAMRIARDTRQPALSGKVRLVQETGRDEQAGFLIYLPIYRNNANPESIQERQRLIKGFVYSPFRAKDLMTAVLNDNYQDIDVEVYDGAEMHKASLLFSTDTTLYYHAPHRRPFSKASTITLGNHTWRLYISAGGNFSRGADSELPNFILLGGSIISLLMFFIIWSLSNTRRSNRLKQTITDNATAALFIIDPKGYCTFMNPAAEELTGYNFAEIQQQPLHNLIHYKHPDGSPFPLSECPIGHALAKQEHLRAHEDVFVRKDGSFFDVSCVVQHIVEHGSVSYTIIEVRDITDEKRAQQAIIESEARFRTMADNAPVKIWMSDEWGQCVYVNKQWEIFSGRSFRACVEGGWRDALLGEDYDTFVDIYKTMAAQKAPFRLELRMWRHDGASRWVVNTGNPRFGVNGEFLGYIGSVIDITEIKQAERKIKENAELLQKLFLEVPAVVGLIRAPEMQYVLANPPYRQLYGNRPLVGKTIYEVHSEQEGRGFFNRLKEVFATGIPFVGNEMPRMIDRHNDGKLVQEYFNLVNQPLLDSKGMVEAVLVFAVEVTELVNARKELLAKNDELRDKNDELLRINNDLDNFVYTASHDLKSPIANMEGLVALLRDMLQDKLGADDVQVLDMVQGAINKLKSTIADLAEITKVQKGLQSAAEPLSFADMLKEITAEADLLGKDAEVTIHTDLQVKHILYARKNLRSILYNLVSNAIKYRSPERAPQVRISTCRQGDYVVLEVEDNGLGIRKEQQHKLFSMFKRLHTHVEGTGIGLYIVKRIIENNGGRIEVESELGKGTRFKVYFKQ